MMNRYRPTEITALSVPTTERNNRNTRNHPAVVLGTCTPSQLIDQTGMEYSGAICVLGDPARGAGIAEAMLRRTEKPFLFIGPAADRNSALSSVLEPEWDSGTLERTLRRGNGAIFPSRPYSSYPELCEYLEEWCAERFLILHLSGGLQIGPEIRDLLCSAGQHIIFCDSVPQALRGNEARTISAKDFLSSMDHITVFSAGAAVKDLIEFLPTYQYERVSNTVNMNNFRSRSVFHPLRAHKGHGLSWGQTRTMEFQKNIFEMDELQALFGSGYALTYNTVTNEVFISAII